MQRSSCSPLLSFIVVLLGACVYSPESDDGTIFKSDRAATFQGFASSPGASVELYGFNRFAGRWDLFATATATTGSIHYGGRDIHPFTIQHRLNTAPSVYIDYFTSPPLGGWVDYQIREPNGALKVLLTFDPGGLDCTVDRVGNGEDLYAAAWACKAQQSDRVRLYYPYG